MRVRRGDHRGRRNLWDWGFGKPSSAPHRRCGTVQGATLSPRRKGPWWRSGADWRFPNSQFLRVRVPDRSIAVSRAQAERDGEPGNELTQDPIPKPADRLNLVSRRAEL